MKKFKDWPDWAIITTVIIVVLLVIAAVILNTIKYGAVIPIMFFLGWLMGRTITFSLKANVKITKDDQGQS